jgi:uncharacterized phiE125 gp8 family phage protein
MPSYLLTPPTAEPVTLVQAKVAARVDDTAFDAIIAAAIPAARVIAEHETGRRLVQQTWRHELVDWPATTDLIPELRPSAVAVAYWDGSAWATLDASAYVWTSAGAGGASIALAPAIGSSWPTLGSVAIGPRVRVDVTSGAADATVADGTDAVLDIARVFIKALVTVVVQDPGLTLQQAYDGAGYLRHVLDPIRLYR